MTGHCIIAFRYKGFFIAHALANLLFCLVLLPVNTADILPYSQSTLPATARLQAKSNPRLDETVRLLFTLTPKKDLTGIRVVVATAWDQVSIPEAKQSVKKGVFLHDDRKLLADGVTLKKGITWRFPFQARFLKNHITPYGNPIEIWIEAGIPSGDSLGTFKEMVAVGKKWRLPNATSKELQPYLPTDKPRPSDIVP